MRSTIYNTPVVKQLLSGVSWLFLKLMGWRLEGRPPNEPKYVLIAVPHTTNWDFPITLAMAFIFNFEIFWMGKGFAIQRMERPSDEMDGRYSD